MKQRLGSVHKIAPGNLVLVRLGNIRRPPRLGLKVYAQEGQDHIGRLIDVIGPVDEPFGVVKLEAGAEIGIGDMLYIEPPTRRNVKKTKPFESRKKRKRFKQGRKQGSKRFRMGRRYRK